MSVRAGEPESFSSVLRTLALKWIQARPSVSPRHRPTPSPTLPPESPPAVNVFTSFSNEHPSLEVNNLLGPIHTNAARLLDEQDRLGIFFVFQDLSIRTEGNWILCVREYIAVPFLSAYILALLPNDLTAPLLPNETLGEFRLKVKLLTVAPYVHPSPFCQQMLDNLQFCLPSSSPKSIW